MTAPIKSLAGYWFAYCRACGWHGQNFDGAFASLNAADDCDNHDRQAHHSNMLEAHVNPDCETGKHTACNQDAWCFIEDAPTSCDCSCHIQVASA